LPIWRIPNKRICIQQVGLVAEERTLKGSYVGSSVPGHDIPRYVDLFIQNRLPVDRIVSDTLRLDDINEVFERLADGRVTRQIISFSNNSKRV
jgi:alcohol dehydrogenase